MMAYTYELNTDGNLISSGKINQDYSSVSVQQQNVLNAVLQYALNIKDDGDIVSDSLSISITEGTSGSTGGGIDGGYSVIIPGDSGGFTPVGFDNTFRQHDDNVTIVQNLELRGQTITITFC